jgi:hypothetical protein
LDNSVPRTKTSRLLFKFHALSGPLDAPRSSLIAASAIIHFFTFLLSSYFDELPSSSIAVDLGLSGPSSLLLEICLAFKVVWFWVGMA